MPIFLKDWLKSLTNDQADKLWDWLDNNKFAAEEMIMIVADTATYPLSPKKEVK